MEDCCRAASAVAGTALILGSAFAFGLGAHLHSTNALIIGGVYLAAGMGLGGVAIYFQILKNRQEALEKTRVEEGSVASDRYIKDNRL